MFWSPFSLSHSRNLSVLLSAPLRTYVIYGGSLFSQSHNLSVLHLSPLRTEVIYGWSPTYPGRASLEPARPFRGGGGWRRGSCAPRGGRAPEGRGRFNRHLELGIEFWDKWDNFGTSPKCLLNGFPAPRPASTPPQPRPGRPSRSGTHRTSATPPPGRKAVLDNNSKC